MKSRTFSPRRRVRFFFFFSYKRYEQKSLLLYWTPNCFSRHFVFVCFLTTSIYICSLFPGYVFFVKKKPQLNIVSHQNDEATLGVPGQSFSKLRLVSSIFHPTGRQGFFSPLLFQSIFTVCVTGKTVKGKTDLMTNARASILLQSPIRSIHPHSAPCQCAKCQDVEQEISADLCVQAGTHMQPLFYIQIIINVLQVAHSPNMVKTLDCSLVSC